MCSFDLVPAPLRDTPAFLSVLLFSGSDNGVHASASPFEGLAEQMNWLGVGVAEHPFGQALLAAGVSVGAVQAWSVDPQVIALADADDSRFAISFPKHFVKPGFCLVVLKRRYAFFFSG